ncbi:Inner membrane protein ycdZ [Serratia odorifera]|uniref:Inner membrane protein ycdZ n=1 Tax=Serratia odorifera TaxID=618 RepID=A0A447KUK2_SEROD|nr:Inner membrane protein ycdZ [Serratia odorifera]
MNVIFAIAVTTGILSGIWGWVAVSLGLIGWAGFLGCTAYFACPQGGLKGLAICALTCCSGVFWAMAIIHGSALDPAWSLLGYALTGVVAFLMCIQAYQQWLGFVPGTFIGACATFAGDGNWRWVTLSLLVGAGVRLCNEKQRAVAGGTRAPTCCINPDGARGERRRPLGVAGAI